MGLRRSSTALSRALKAIVGLLAAGLSLVLVTTQLKAPADGTLIQLKKQIETRRSVVDRMLIKLDNGSVSDRTSTQSTSTITWEE